MFYSKVAARSVNTFIPLEDETINSSIIERGRSLMDSQPRPLLYFSSKWNRRPRMSFCSSPKMWKSEGERSGLCGGCWSVSQTNLRSLSFTRLAVWGWALSCKRMIPSDSIPEFDFIECSSTLSHQEKNHTSLLASILNAGWTHFTLRPPPEQWRNNCVDRPFLLWMSHTLQMKVASFCEECVLWRVFGFHLTTSHIMAGMCGTVISRSPLGQISRI